jgi:hypothetical protein
MRMLISLSWKEYGRLTNHFWWIKPCKSWANPRWLIRGLTSPEWFR